MIPKPFTLQQFFSRPSRWTKGVTARDHNGNPCEADSKHAAALCLSAAVHHIYGETEEIPRRLLEIINEDLDHTQAFETLADWNDEEKRTFKDIRALITKADL